MPKLADKKPKDKNNEIDKFLIYFILSPLVVAFILCLLYVRLVFLCHFEQSWIEKKIVKKEISKEKRFDQRKKICIGSVLRI